MFVFLLHFLLVFPCIVISLKVVVVVYFDLGVDGDVRCIRWIELEIELHLLLFVGGDLLQVAGSAQCTPSQLLMAL